MSGLEKNRLHSRGERPAADRLPRALLRTLRVATISPPISRTSSTTFPAAAIEWQAVLEAFWRDFKPKTAEVMEQKPSEITAALDDFLAPWLFPDKGDGVRSAPLPGLRRGPAGAARRPLRRLRRLLQLSRMQVHPPLRPGRRGRRARMRARRCSASDPETRPGGDACASGRFGPYVQLGEGKEAKRASMPKDVPRPSSTSSCALKLLSLPRTVGAHPGERQADHRRASAATAPISPMTANMRSSARPPRCSRPA